jgi:hypothetical protein
MYFPNQLMTFALQSLSMSRKHLGNACIEGIPLLISVAGIGMPDTI